MEEQKKDECCQPSNSGCGSCCGSFKKLIVALVLGLVVFTCGYVVGKGYCPMSGQKICPLTQH
jgi:hypothetical protein